ncbi:MAG: DUF971 family protein [Pirellulaceae bacterium]|jgi:DUF971 family protein
MEVYPTSIERLEDGGILIEWSDGARRKYGLVELRDKCPCATCREKKRAPKIENPLELPILTPQEAMPLGITGMKPMGSYAYSIAFTDGHDTGIYSFDLLRRLGEDC